MHVECMVWDGHETAMGSTRFTSNVVDTRVEDRLDVTSMLGESRFEGKTIIIFVKNKNT
jgi:hypothetical protein